MEQKQLGEKKKGEKKGRKCKENKKQTEVRVVVIPFFLLSGDMKFVNHIERGKTCRS